MRKQAVVTGDEDNRPICGYSEGLNREPSLGLQRISTTREDFHQDQGT